MTRLRLWLATLSPALSLTLVLGCLIGLAAPPAQAQSLATVLGQGRQRLALVVGIGTLGTRQVVDSAPRDTQAVAAALRATGFVVMLREDVIGSDLRAALDEFRRRLKSGDIGVAYFTGLGAQVNGQNLLLARDTVLEGGPDTLAARLKSRGVPLQELVDALQGTRESPRYLVVDAAYRHPLLVLPKAGLADQELPPGMMAIFGSALGAAQEVPAVAPLPEPPPIDPREIAASRFTRALVGALITPRITGVEALRNTQRTVSEATRGQTTPWLGGATDTRQEFAETSLIESLLPRDEADVAREAVRQGVRTTPLRSSGEQSVSEILQQSAPRAPPPATAPVNASTGAEAAPRAPTETPATSAPAAPTSAPTPAPAPTAPAPGGSSPSTSNGGSALGSTLSAAGTAASVVGTAAALAVGARAAEVAIAATAAGTLASAAGSGASGALALASRLGSGNSAEQPARQVAQAAAAAAPTPVAAAAPAPAPAATPELPADRAAPIHIAPAAGPAMATPATAPTATSMPAPPPLDGRTVRTANGGERPVFTPRANSFGHAEGDTFSYQVIDIWKDEVVGSYTTAIEEVLGDGKLLANGNQTQMDAQGRLTRQRLPDGSVSQFEPAQELWWSNPRVGDSRDVLFTESFSRPGVGSGQIEFKGSSKVGKLRNIETPAGVFEAMPIESSGWYYQTMKNGARSSGRFSRTTWYAPKLGHPVAVDIEDTDRVGKLLRRERVELLHAQQARATP